MTFLAGTGLLWAEGPKPGKPASTALERKEGRGLYDWWYARRRKVVDETRDTADDIALAAEHLANLTTFHQGPMALRLVLCEQAFELAMRHRDGYATAIEAAEILLRDHPESREQYLPKAIHAYRAQCRSNRTQATSRERLIELYAEQARASAGKDRYDDAFAVLADAYGVALAARSPRRDKILALRRYCRVRHDLQRKPSDLRLRRESVLMAVRELDAPAEAGTLLVDKLDEDLRTFVSLAAKPQKDVAEAACLRLGDWYLGLAKGASPRGKRLCLKRAQGYLDRFFSVHKARDESGVKAELLLARVDTQLAAIDATAAAGGAPQTGPPPRADDWIDLLTDYDPKARGVVGTWSRQGEALRYDGPEVTGNARPRIGRSGRRTFSGSYDIEVSFVRHSGEGAIRLLLPVGVQLVIDSQGVSGLAMVKGRNAADNETGVLIPIVNGKRYTVNVTVLGGPLKTEITVSLNGERIVNWAGLSSDLGTGKLLIPSSGGRPVIAAMSSATFYTVRCRYLSKY